MPGKVDLVVGEKIAIGILGAVEQVNQPVHEGGKRRVWLCSVDAGGRVQPFIGIRVSKEPAFAEAILFSGCDAEVIDATAGFQLFPLVEDGTA